LLRLRSPGAGCWSNLERLASDMGWVGELRLAFGFLTALPVSQPLEPGDAGAFGRSFAWYPLVGGVVGVLLIGGERLLDLGGLESGVRAWLLLLAWVALTGGLHLDGLMDSCDALLAAVSVERRLEILKDVHAGAFGILGVVLVVGLKGAVLTQLGVAPWPLLWSGLLLAPVWGRWMLVWAARRYPYARAGSSLGSIMRQGLGLRQLVVATIVAVVLQGAVALFYPPSLIALVGPLLGLLLAGLMARRLDGGLTGDTYGALCELVEVGVLLVLAW
jgi:adenosylcobinamide-GDP ribazoletransferase